MSTDRNQLQLPSPASVARERVLLVAENVARHSLKEVANGGRAAPYDTASTLHHDLTDRSGGDPSESPDDEEFKKLCSLFDEDEDESQDGELSLEIQLPSTFFPRSLESTGEVNLNFWLGVVFDLKAGPK